MAKRLYAGNLSYSATSEELFGLFGRHGKVDTAQVLDDRSNGRSRGFAFVEMANDLEADAAIAGLDGAEFQGRRLNVTEARLRTPGDSGRPRGGNSWGGPPDRGTPKPKSGGLRSTETPAPAPLKGRLKP
jgi:RNA recognition motif-containing protein